MSISGNRALVGAHRDFEPGVGFSGSAYIFEYDGSNWSEQVKLKPSDAPTGDWFGRAVRLRDNRAIIGSYRSYDAYIFEFDGNNWIEMAKLSPAITETNFQLGIAVDIEGDRAVVGTREDGSGAVYVYEYDGIEWNETAQLTASDGEQDDLFGNAVSLLGDRVVIGAREDDNFSVNSGAAYVFDFDGNFWNETTKLTASDGANSINFAWSVSLSDDRLAIGNNSNHAYVFDFDGIDWLESFKLAPFAGVDAGGFAESVSLQDDVLVIGARYAADGGTAFVYQFDGINWSEATQLTASGGENGDQFGNAVSHSGDKVLIGAYSDDDRGTDAGAAYVFDLNSTYLDDLIYRNGFDTDEINRDMYQNR